MPYQNLRKGRVSEQGRIYFITSITSNRIPFFEDLFIARELVKCMRSIHTEVDVTFLTWVIMPDHAHWLIQLKGECSLSKVINRLKGVSAFRINKLLGRRGKFWQENYFDHAIRKDEDLKSIARYIVANPLRAELAQEIGEYPPYSIASTFSQ